MVAVTPADAVTPVDAVIFDTDGVITRTAAVHFAAWKDLFDGVLAGPLAEGATDRSPFTDDDYRSYVDGMARYDGVARFLESRGIVLQLGAPEDPAGTPSVCGLGNQKNEAFLAALDVHGVEAFDGTVRLLEALRAAGVATAAISASENAGAVLARAAVDHLFDARVDGCDARDLDLPGKPDPAIFLEAARRLGVAPSRAGVVEDAVAGVAAGRKGGFALVVGVDRTAHPEALAGDADVVVPDLADLMMTPEGIRRSLHPEAPVDRLTSALTDPDVRRRFEGREAAVFLDYDGTLTPLVARPEDAVLSSDTRAVLRDLAENTTVGILSGRDLDEVREMVGVEGLWYGGSHGFELLSPAGERHQVEGSTDVLPALRSAGELLDATVPEVEGAWVEHKRFAIAVHYRATPPEQVDGLQRRVASVADAMAGLHLAGGNRIFELRPDLPWDKGRALRHVMHIAAITPPALLPVYVGDDVTDEDAFLAVRSDGLGVRVGADPPTTAAHHRLADTDEVRGFLSWIIETTKGSSR